MPWKPSEPGERPTLGWYVLDWIEENLTVVDGPAVGEPLVFTQEQAQFILRLYEVNPDFTGSAITGRVLNNARIVRRAVLSRPKGWGKSPLVAALCLVEALGDVVLDGWDANGQPVGRTWASLGMKPKVQIVAVSEDQTANTWEPCLDMARSGPVYDNYAIEPMESWINVPKGRVEAVTSSGTSREGFRPVFTAMDQTESWTRSNGGKKLAATIRRNLGKVQGCSVETPNAFNPGEDSVAEKSYEGYAAQLAGRARVAGLYYDHREGYPETDIEDRESLVKGLKFAYGDSADVAGGWVNLDRIADEFWDTSTDPQDARRYYLNQITHASDAWLSQLDWAAIKDTDSPLQDGDAIAIGFDGSRGRARGKADATALIGCRIKDGHLFQIGVWEAPEGATGRDWSPPTVEVDAAVRHAFGKWRVVAFYADPSGWVEHVVRWESEFGRRVRVKCSPMNPFTAWPKGKGTAVAEYVERLRQAVAVSAQGVDEDGNEVTPEVTHDGSYGLTRHMLNARMRPCRNGYLIHKAYPDSPQKIDAAYAAVMAYKGRLDAIARGLNGSGAGKGRMVVMG